MNAPTRLNHTPSHHSRWQPYARHAPLLGLGLVFFLLTLYMMLQISPAQIEISFLPKLHLPFQIMTFLSMFFLASFLTLNTRRGYLLAAFGQTLIFLRLQQVVLTREVVISLIGIFVIIEVLLSVILFLASHANLSQKPHLHRRSRHS